MKQSKQMLFTSMATVLLLSACGTDSGPNEQPEQREEENHEESMDHSDMDHSSSGELPEGLAEASNPRYALGTEAMIAEGHMEGMEGTTAEIEGAEETTVYMVDYTSTTGEDVENHKWVTEKELSSIEE